MFFAHPFKKPILTEIKKTPLFAENWINVAKVGNRLFFGYHDFGTRLASITGGGMLITYDKDGTLTGNLYFGFLEDDPRFEQLTGTLEPAGPGAHTPGSMLSSLKPKSSITSISLRKSGLAWVKVPRI